MAKYLLLVGAPGAGKSSIRKHLKGRGVCPDEIRDKLKVDAKTAYDIARDEIKKMLLMGVDVILDATNNSPEKRMGMIAIGGPFADEVVCVWLDTPYEICVARHEARLAEMRARGEDTSRYEDHDKPYTDIIKGCSNAINADPPILSEGFDLIIRIVPLKLPQM